MARAVDDWPRTTRVLPWLLAAFVVMLWVVPFDAINLPFRLPIDAKFDRFFLVVVIGVWLLSRSLGGREAPRAKRSWFDVAIGAMLVAALLSIVVNATSLVRLDEYALALKQLSLLLSYFLFFYIAVSILRPSEVRAFVLLVIALACITAVGAIYEYRTDQSPFYLMAREIPSITVAEDPAGLDSQGRRTVNGPTAHGLAVAAMMSLVIPFVLVGLQTARRNRDKLLYVAALTLVIAGSISTVRKTSIIAAAAAGLVMLAFRPRQTLKLVPVLAVIMIGIHGVIPGAMGSVRNQLEPQRLINGDSTEGRKEDYKAIAPDVRHQPVFGRGYGTYSPHRYRFIDNQLLLIVLETGYFGVAMYLLFPLMLIAVALALVRGRHRLRAPFGVAAVASAVAFTVSSLTFDVLAFPHVPYVFFLLAAMTVVLASEEKRRRDPEAELAPVRPDTTPPAVSVPPARVPEPALR